MRDWQLYRDTFIVIGPSLIAAAALAVGGPLVGLFVLLRREGLLALALPQVVAVGAAAGVRNGWPFLPPAIVAALLALLITAWARARNAAHLFLPALYVGGLSLSILIIYNSQQHLHELQHLLTGEDVFVTAETARVVAPTLLLAGGAAATVWRRWLLIAQSPTAARVAGLHPERWDALFLLLLATVVVVGTSASGILMVLVTLFLPAATVMPWARRIPAAMVSAVAASILFLAAGFVLSVEMGWPFSQSVGGVGFAALILSHAVAATMK